MICGELVFEFMKAVLSFFSQVFPYSVDAGKWKVSVRLSKATVVENELKVSTKVGFPGL